MKPICFLNESQDFSQEVMKKLEKYFLVRTLSSLKKSEYHLVEIVFVRLAEGIDDIFLSRFENVKILCSPTTGLNHIDLPLCRKKGIKVISLRDEQAFLTENITATSEFTWALFLTIWRKIIVASQDVKEGKWRRDNFKSSQLKGKSIGIVGMGRVGKRLMKYGKAFELSVSYYDPFVDSESGKKNSIKDLLLENKIIFICCNYTSKTHHLFDETVFKYVNNGSIIVNTARGEIIKTQALCEVILEKEIFYASDVLEDEQNIFCSNKPCLLSERYADNVLITPHIAGACLDAMHLTENLICDRLIEEICLKV